jgi:hypothetical protein
VTYFFKIDSNKGKDIFASHRATKKIQQKSITKKPKRERWNAINNPIACGTKATKKMEG